MKIKPPKAVAQCLCSGVTLDEEEREISALYIKDGQFDDVDFSEYEIAECTF